jgi:hypothetical protein
MRLSLFTRPVAALLCLTLAVIPTAARASQKINCSSEGGRYQYCRANTDNEVRLERRLSGARCSEGSTWGYDRYGVWVDRGCRGEFRVGRGGSNDRAAAVGAAIAGAAIIAAVAASKNSHQSNDVPSCAIGDYTGYDDYERSEVQLSIYPGGNVSGYAGRNSFDGRFTGSRLETPRLTFRVERSGNGFFAIDERDARHRVYFTRTGRGGY